MIGPEAEQALRTYVAHVLAAPVSLSSITDPGEAWRLHILDSLTGLELAEVRGAGSIADIGSGGGFPGVPLAAALPRAQVDLIESVGRKCDAMAEALEASGIANARPVRARAEEWAREEGREAYDVVSARAVGPLAELAELASPLLREGGALVAWKGARDEAEEAVAAGAAAATAVEPRTVVPVRPFAESRERHLHLLVKSGPTPERLPRRPGMARKRPLS